MTRALWLAPACVAAVLCGPVDSVAGQAPMAPASMGTPSAAESHRPTGRVSFTVDSVQTYGSTARRLGTEFTTAVTFATPEFDNSGVEYGLNMRQSRRAGSDAQRFSVYEGFAGARLGHRGQVRLRAGHMWLPDLGTVGALAGALAEVRSPGTDRSAMRMRAGLFAGREPLVYRIGYAPNVSKVGGYVAVEQGYLRRHVLGYARVRQGALTERSVLTISNYVPVGDSVFVYQAAEVDVKGPVDGQGQRGLSYLLTNVRYSASPRVELFGSYNRGRALDVRSMTDDLLNERAVTATRLEGLRYESTGGRVTVEVMRNIRVYAGYSRDRNNRDDAASGRLLMGGHAGNVLGFDISASNSRVERPLGAYNSRYLSVGHAIGRAGYASVDYATSLSVVRFMRSDGVVIETRPWMRRLTGNASFTVGRRYSFYATADYELDDEAAQTRVITGMSVRY